MIDILEPIGSAFSGLVDNSAVQLTGRLFVLYLIVVWVATAWWAFRDVSQRTTSLPAPFLVAGLFTLATPLFFLPIAIVYRVVRPSETLAEASERDLTETALEATPTQVACPSCGSAIEDDWRLCPWCRYELLVPCPRCTRLVEVAWPVCPWCVAELPWRREPVPVMAGPPDAPTVWPEWGAAATSAGAPSAADGRTTDESGAPEPATSGSSGRSSTAIW
jgi:RNA polymerase subunit RPABC4/transcription elongation factor Spt4